MANIIELAPKKLAGVAMLPGYNPMVLGGLEEAPIQGRKITLNLPDGRRSYTMKQVVLVKCSDTDLYIVEGEPL